MKKISRVSHITAYIVLFAGMFLMYSCSGSSSGSDSDSGGTGSITFSLQAPVGSLSSASGSELLYKAASIDCERLGVVSVEAEVYDENEDLIAQGGPWECSIGEGIIYGVIPGNNRTVLIFLRDENGLVLFSGTKSEITVIAGQTTDAGTIILVGAEEEEDNQAPTAVDDSARVVRGGRVSLLDSDEGSVVVNDYDEDGDSLAVSTTPLSGPSNGSVTLYQDGTFIYAHDGSETSSDSFTYEVSDGRGGAASATVYITVLNDAQDNNPPVLSGGSVTPDSGDTEETFTYSVHYRDTDGHAASVMDVYIDGTAHGMVLTDGAAYDGTYTYRTALLEGRHSYFFICSDGYAGSARLPAAEVFTGPSVNAANHEPVAEDDQVSVVQGGRTLGDVLKNDYDEDDDDLTVTPKPLSGPEYGSVTLNEDGSFVYSHDGSEIEHDSFTYEVSDGRGGSATATVSITVSLDPQDNHEPLLTGGAVSQGAGDVSVSFSFSVYYSDEDGHAPQEKYVYIGGKAYDMILTSGSTYDGTYTAGTDLGTGEHEYYFMFTDGYGGSARLPETGSYSGPAVVAVAYFVSASRGSDDRDGSIEYPFATIGHAADVAEGSEGSPVTIFIAAGLYGENLVLDSWESFSGGWLDDFSRQWNFTNSGITPEEEYETVLDGTGQGRCLTITEADGIVINGITIENGQYVSGDVGGGGIFIASCSPEIVNCRIVNNSTVSDQSYAYGGGIYIYAGDPTISNCIFSGNSATGTQGYGGGIYNQGSNPVITNCMFTGNISSGIDFSAGGAIGNTGSNPVITNCTLALNDSTSGHSKAGGIYNSSSAPVITNSIIWGNTATYNKEMYNVSSDLAEITYCDIEQNMGESETVHDNIRQDPLFVDAASGDLHLGGNSPCIDAGLNDVQWILETDFDGDPRIINDYIDMGADEVVDAYVQ